MLIQRSYYNLGYIVTCSFLYRFLPGKTKKYVQALPRAVEDGLIVPKYCVNGVNVRSTVRLITYSIIIITLRKF